MKDGKVERVTVDGYVITGKRQDGDTFKTIRPAIQDNGLIGDLVNNNVVVEGKQPEQQSIWTQLLVASFPILVIIAVFMFFMRQMQGGGGGRGGPMSFGKSKARLLSEDQVKTTFADVAGCDEAKEEVSELVEFLRDPGKFQRLGGRIPRGVLMVGPPGTGKTLLAKAIAGEAKVPFFTISGSDFVEMFVGVGASRVRDMFDQAKKHAPCIIFIDEIDAVGRHRGGSGLGGGHDEREQTLNQLLVEMDGFEANDGVIVIAATNRADVLDSALLRPGRFDRQVEVGLPDVRGREQILKVHMRKVPVGDDVDPAIIARGTPGFSGADLANLVNEASLFAARSNKRIVDMREFELAKDKIIMGAERRSMAMSEEEKLMTAYHESGHAILGCLFPSDPIHKVTIIPRGRALGVTISLPEADRLSYKRDWMHNRLMMIFGGRIAEELIFGYDKVSNGASSDITSATRLARTMVTQWGMSDRLGFLSYADDSDSAYPGMGRKEFSEETARIIDEEVRNLIDGNYAKAKLALHDNRDKMEVMANALMKYETLDADQVGDIMAGREPREPRDWQGGNSGSSGSAAAPRDESGRQENPIGGPAGEH